jgi:hypothetical protein
MANIALLTGLVALVREEGSWEMIIWPRISCWLADSVLTRIFYHPKAAIVAWKRDWIRMNLDSTYVLNDIFELYSICIPFHKKSCILDHVLIVV